MTTQRLNRFALATLAACIVAGPEAHAAPLPRPADLAATAVDLATLLPARAHLVDVGGTPWLAFKGGAAGMDALFMPLGGIEDVSADQVCAPMKAAYWFFDDRVAFDPVELRFYARRDGGCWRDSDTLDYVVRVEPGGPDKDAEIVGKKGVAIVPLAALVPGSGAEVAFSDDDGGVSVVLRQGPAVSALMGLRWRPMKPFIRPQFARRDGSDLLSVEVRRTVFADGQLVIRFDRNNADAFLGGRWIGDPATGVARWTTLRGIWMAPRNRGDQTLAEVKAHDLWFGAPSVHALELSLHAEESQTPIPGDTPREDRRIDLRAVLVGRADSGAATILLWPELTSDDAPGLVLGGVPSREKPLEGRVDGCTVRVRNDEAGRHDETDGLYVDCGEMHRYKPENWALNNGGKVSLEVRARGLFLDITWSVIALPDRDYLGSTRSSFTQHVLVPRNGGPGLVVAAEAAPAVDGDFIR